MGAMRLVLPRFAGNGLVIRSQSPKHLHKKARVLDKRAVAQSASQDCLRTKYIVLHGEESTGPKKLLQLTVLAWSSRVPTRNKRLLFHATGVVRLFVLFDPDISGT